VLTQREKAEREKEMGKEEDGSDQLGNKNRTSMHGMPAASHPRVPHHPALHCSQSAAGYPCLAARREERRSSKQQPLSRQVRGRRRVNLSVPDSEKKGSERREKKPDKELAGSQTLHRKATVINEL
jgi:hypothetical protein